jgi:hypothetical protein
MFAATCLVLGVTRLAAQDVIQIGPKTSSWSEEKWPFPIDQWGTGQAFGCTAERCGRDLHLYLRPKIGFCRCATGVSDDDEIEWVGDLELIEPHYKALGSGHPVSARTMSGRARVFAVERPLQPDLPVLTIALAHRCDAIVVTLLAEPQAQAAAEAQALEFLRSATVQHWVEHQGGTE